ncbi:Cof-like, HAD superfamily hydrolase [Moraxella macacae 0408225]|uniref:Cof-like, HAD superfamily hydrolase n=1 Tax=Moraxella macacae 0408225 TaxID=1230338 RepID=L2F4R5_9GAMM|nr:Cof-type HAD-IIB family hydrolase [Moraxella macacae]ELA08002.1 Cof-like, HAD superfamily hydrolase [Moraxella macacae 0408225]
MNKHNTKPAPPKIIFFDIDDTLYLKQQNRVPDSIKQVFLALKQRGILIAIATGRGLGVFPPVILQLIDEIGIDVIVTINGQYVLYRNKPLVDFALDKKDVVFIREYLHKIGVACAYMTADKIVALSETCALKNALNALHIPYTLNANFDDTSQHSEKIYQILAFYDNNQDENLMQILPKHLKTIRWHISGVDILDANGSKARGIKAVLDKLNLNMTQAWAFGDGLNDIEMLKAVGFGIAMGNGHTDLKQVADFVCPNADEDGILKALHKFQVI